MEDLILLEADGSFTTVAEGVDIHDFAKEWGGVVVRRDEYVSPPYVPTLEALAQAEVAWGAATLNVIARQLEAIEEDEADVTPPDILPGTRKQWLKYRGQVSNWNETNADFPEITKRPVAPT